MNERTKKEYWDKRALGGDSPHKLVLNDVYLEEFEKATRHILSIFKDKKVLDVACGYGRLSDAFKTENYTGIDFSTEMIKLARKKYPDKQFEVWDIREKNIANKFDVVFEAMSLSSLEMTPEKFYEKFKNIARHAVICFEPHVFTIFYL